MPPTTHDVEHWEKTYT
ncbi:hypothetical protein SCARD494_05994 [Seiridium cardinale]